MQNCLFNREDFFLDNIKAIDAKGEAQKIAFSPLTFCAVNSMKELGVLKALEDSGDHGVTVAQISQKLKISEYASKVLCEVALLMGVARLAKSAGANKDFGKAKEGEGEGAVCKEKNGLDFSNGEKGLSDSTVALGGGAAPLCGERFDQCNKSATLDDGAKSLEKSYTALGKGNKSFDKSTVSVNKGAASTCCESENEGEEYYTLGKIGWMLLNDELTRVNFNFVRDVCYLGAADLMKSLKAGKPEGLKVFGDKWATVYDALSSLSDNVKKSWFDFDHFYSDIAFSDALPIVFEKKPKTICDIGGNTAKFSIAACKYDENVKMTIVDLPGQVAVAKVNAKAAGFDDRIVTHEANVLASTTELPEGQDVFWMSQFLDCFSLEDVTRILQKVYKVARSDTKVFVLEPLWDMQRFSANSFSLVATSLYFSCIANGKSKMYRFTELKNAIEKAGFTLETAHHNLGSNSYSLLVFRKAF